MADNFVERVKELFSQNNQAEAAELLRNMFDENTELKRQLAESKTLLEVATKQQFEDFTKFSRAELAAATKNFNESVKIGEGSCGSVYKGILRYTPVAIKMLNHEGSKVLEKEFNQEVEVLSKVRHPNLVSLIGASLDARALVYNYLPNGSLDTYISNGKNKNKLPLQDRLRIASEICAALNCLHTQGIAHGDLKPENVLLDAGLVSKLSDFGLSRKLENSNETMTPMHVTARPKGSLAYIDPVYLAFGELTPQSDIFAFGIILLQFVTGRDPRGLRTDVEQAVDRKKLDKLIDNSVGKWPTKEAMKLVDLGLKCSEQKRKQRPNLKYVWDTIEEMKQDASTSGRSRWSF